jgi:N-acetyl-gamma-glutamyl-phosphate reductase
VTGSDLVFIALPSGEAMGIMPELVGMGMRVIDLGGDFRLKDPALYRSYYGREHNAPDLLPDAIYGLSELNRPAIAGADVIANPGCYPTSAILPLAPLLAEGVIRTEGIAITSMSGVSGAGRSSSVEMSFSEVNENLRAYKATTHQHIPEIRAALSIAAGSEVSLSFIPHLVPITRGIYTTIHAPLAEDATQESIAELFGSYYGMEPFIRVSSTAIPEIRNVTHTNCIDIGFRVDTGNRQVVLFSAIDNLVKGAAGQAVQNMNIMLGYPETEGLQ